MTRLLLLVLLSTSGCADFRCHPCRYQVGDIVETRLGRKAMVTSSSGCARIYGNGYDYGNCTYHIAWDDSVGQPQWRNVHSEELKDE